MVTRPAHQAARLCELIRAAGGEAVAFPVLEIAPIEDPGPVRADLAKLRDFDVALFVSANAVEHAADFVGASELPATLRLAAVGQRTADALRQRYGRVDIEAPPPYNSESLLATAALLQVRGARILIVRGTGGRELLADTLRARGAEVHYTEVYRRLEPERDFDAELTLHPDIGLIVVTSNEGLRNLVNMAGERRRPWLLATPLVVISRRTAELAETLGFTRPAGVARAATDEALLEAMIAWRQSPEPQGSKGRTMSELTLDDKAKNGETPPLLPPPGAPPHPDEPRLAAVPSVPGKRTFTVSTIVAIIAVAWISAGLYLVWHELALTRTEFQTRAESAQQEIAALNQRLEKAENQLGNVVTGDLEELHTQQEGIEDLLDSLRDKVERNPQSWLTAEAAYLLRTANDRLRLEGDIATTLVALEAADRRLQSLGDPSLFEVRRLLSQEINALRALPAVDVTGLALHLGALNDRIEQLPFPQASGTVVAADETPSAEQGWRKVAHDLWQELRKLVVIKHKDSADQVLLTPDERELLKQNLRLSLEAAQVALIRRDDKVFHDQLRRAGEWIERYYDRSAAATQNTLQELAQLQAANLAPPLPNISASLTALEDWQVQRRSKNNKDTGEGAP